MAKFTAKDINDLRKSTGVGMMDCKKALVEADGDMEKAVTLLREKGLATQAKKSGRVAAEGICTAVVKGNVGCVLEVNIETDFAANNDEFKAFVAAVADTVIETNPADVDALKATKISGGDKTVEETLQDLFIKIRENIVRKTKEIYCNSDFKDDLPIVSPPRANVCFQYESSFTFSSQVEKNCNDILQYLKENGNDDVL